MWLPRTLPLAQGKAGTPAAFAVPSANQAPVRLPFSVPHAAAPEVAQSPADEILKLAAAARLRRQQQQQQQQGLNENLRQQRSAGGRPQDIAMPRSLAQDNFLQQRRSVQQRQQTSPSRTADRFRNPDSAATSNNDVSEPLTKALQQRPAGRTSAQQQEQQQQQPQQRRHLTFSIGSDQDWSLKTGMAVTWLGTSSGSPTKERNISCTLVRVPEAVYMVDVGEGSYRQIRKTGIQLQQVDTIFLTHLHGDHCFGIGSMLISLCNARRKAMQDQQQQQPGSQHDQHQQQLQGPDQGPDKLRVVGGPKLGQFVSALLAGAGVGRQLDMPVYVTEFVEDGRNAHDWQPLPGCAPGQAYLRRLAPETVQWQGSNTPAWVADLQHRLDESGLDWQSHPANYRPNGFIAKPDLVWRIPCQHAMVSAAQLQHRIPCWGYVFDEQQPAQQGQQRRRQQLQQYPSGRRVVILGDTVDSAAIAPHAYGADFVSHEATFAAGMEGKAALAQHSTAWMAGQFAAAIAAKALVLTHFSARYEGSMANDVAGHKGKFGMNMGPGAARYNKGHDKTNKAAAEEAEDKAAEQRAVKLLSREAEAHYNGQVLLAIDLFTTHVPKREQEGSS